MSKKSRTRVAEQRKKEKRARKERQRALYESYKTAGQNKKSKRVALGAKRVRMVRLKSHPNGACGNVGCERCFPHLRRHRCNESR